MIRANNIIVCAPSFEAKRGRPLLGDNPMTATERKARTRGTEKADRIERVAILDMETDPFDNVRKSHVSPFLAVLYSDDFEPVIIWEENQSSFLDVLISAIEGLPGRYTIYAHNGGKFDYMFLVHKLRGHIKFKGRGIMAAQIGRHEIRDSFHIIPEKLANLQKDSFDYQKMQRATRNQYKEEIIRYCIADCRYLLEYVKKFLNDYGFKISIGQAAMFKLRKEYPDIKRIGENMDAFLRNYFFGGRVECLAGAGHFVGDYKLFDVNSMYPDVMARLAHPVGNSYIIRRGKPGPNTVFIDLECKNFGALVRRNDNNETSANEKWGQFRTTIWEYEMALKHGLIEQVHIKYCIDCEQRTTFERFINPLYEQRLLTKGALKTVARGTIEYNNIKKDDIFLKLIMNNAYGKFAQNPRRFKESFITDPHDMPPDDTWGLLPKWQRDTHWIWERRNPLIRFNNVGTAASITGAARAVLMDAIQNAIDPIYCDTDSLICRDLAHVDLDPVRLGAWDLESEFDEVMIAGKKLYACKVAGYPDGHEKRIKVASKGVQATWNDIERVLDEQLVELINKAPTLTKLGEQDYRTRTIRRTAPRRATIQQRRRIAA